MDENNKPHFAGLLLNLAAIYGEEISEPRMDGYFNLLRDYSLEDVSAAAGKLARSSKFFPKVAEFVEAIDGTIEETASTAWYDYLKALDRPGPYQTLDIGNPIAHAVVAEMNLWGLGIEQSGYPDQREDGGTWLRIEFIRRYKIYAAHSDPSQLPRTLPGIFECENKKKIALGEPQSWTTEQRALVGIIDKPQLEAPAKSPIPTKPENALPIKNMTFLTPEQIEQKKKEFLKAIQPFMPPKEGKTE